MEYQNINTIILNQRSNSSTDNSVQNLQLPTPYKAEEIEVALLNTFIYYSWRNITTTFNNNTFSYWFPDLSTGVMTEYSITVPDGFYTIDDLNGFLELKMYENGHYLLDSGSSPVYYLNITANSVYYAITLTCTVIPTSLPTGFSNPNSWNFTNMGNKTPLLTVPSNNFTNIIGFNAGTYPTVTQSTTYQKNSDYVPQVSPVSTVMITCNLANNSLLNTNGSVIYQFSPNVGYGSLIQVQPPQLIWLPCNSGFYPNIIVQYLDQNYNRLGILDTNITTTLAIRKKPKKLLM